MSVNFNKQMSVVSVLFLGIGNPTPTFIRNRIIQLDKKGQLKAIVLVPRESRNEFPLDNGLTLPQLPVKFSFRQTIFSLLWFSIRFPVSTVRLWHSVALYRMQVRIRIFIKYHSLVRVQKINIVHFQWIVSSDEIKWARGFFKAPVIISARGSQLTVYPATESGYEDKIRKSLLSVDYIHAVSQSMAEACIRFGADPDKIFVNYNGIDIEKFNTSSIKEITDDTLHLISTGTLMWRKGYLWQLFLIRALKETGMKVNLKIIGDGPDRQGLQYTIIRLGLQDAVTLDGHKTPDEVIKSLQLSDIYISTSAAEGLSNAVLESIACGLPAIAFDCEGMNEVIKEGNNGFIVPFGDLEAMTEKVRIMNNDRKLLASMGLKSAKMAAEKFDYRMHIQNMIDFYRSVSLKHE